VRVAEIATTNSTPMLAPMIPPTRPMAVELTGHVPPGRPQSPTQPDLADPLQHRDQGDVGDPDCAHQ
jgi:hypothetical protein